MIVIDGGISFSLILNKLVKKKRLLSFWDFEAFIFIDLKE